MSEKKFWEILGNLDLSVTIPVDFPSLKEINRDIYAWIDIPDTNVHYPIVQSDTDDSYYLDHTIEHVKGLPGSIYTEEAILKYKVLAAVAYDKRHIMYNFDQSKFEDSKLVVLSTCITGQPDKRWLVIGVRSEK